VVVLGHVDSGKTSLLDKIRGTAVASKEAGGITQHIGASFLPTTTLQALCGALLTRLKADIKIPGLLIIDTPGHEVFSNLRLRGGSAADIAILVVDVLKGFEPQTYESVEILKSKKVPFVIALNKIDMIKGWKIGKSQFLTESLKIQEKFVLEFLDKQIYNVVGSLAQLGFNSEAFWRVGDFTKQIAIVPTSAKTGEGIPELLTVLAGLTQQYMKKRLSLTLERARGIVLEVKEEIGLGDTINAILIDGVLKVGDSIVLAKREGCFITKVRAILVPKPLDEIREPRDKFASLEEVRAAAGIKIVAPDLKDTLAGSPFVAINSEEEFQSIKAEIEKDIRAVILSTDKLGVVVKADTLGSLEALVNMLNRRNVSVKLADIGPVSKRDVTEAYTVKEKDKYLGVILAFNVKVLPDAEQESLNKNVKIFSSPIIYSLIDDYFDWVKQEKEAEIKKLFEAITPPSKFKILKGYVFRRSDPAIFGVEVLVGRLKQKAKVMNKDGKEIGIIHQIQDKGNVLQEAKEGSQVAVSMMEPIFGRQIHEEEILYTSPTSEEAKLLLTKYKNYLSNKELELLNEIIQIRRKSNPVYAL